MDTTISLPVRGSRLLRCSDLDRLHKCNASVLSDIETIGSSDKTAASIGTVVHSIIADRIHSGIETNHDAREICEKHGITDHVEDVDRLYSYAAYAWQQLKQYMPAPTVESPVSSHPFDVMDRVYSLSGQVDVLSRTSQTTATAIDWKTGRGSPDRYVHQMQGYAYCVWDMMGRPSDGEITTISVFLAHGHYQVVKHDMKSMSEWMYNLKRNVLTKPDLYIPGSHCTDCEKSWSCKAKQKATSESISAFMMKGMKGQDGYDDFVDKCVGILNDPQSTKEAVGAVLTTLMQRMELVRRAVDDTDEVIRECVQRLGDIPLADGSAIGFRSSTRKSIKAGKAMPILSAMLQPENLYKCMTISLPKAKQEVARNLTGKGKRDEMRRLEDVLDSAGAIETKEIVKLQTIGSEDDPESEQ